MLHEAIIRVDLALAGHAARVGMAPGGRAAGPFKVGAARQRAKQQDQQQRDAAHGVSGSLAWPA
jgi:hypothetical protein